MNEEHQDPLHRDAATSLEEVPATPLGLEASRDAAVSNIVTGGAWTILGGLGLLLALYGLTEIPAILTALASIFAGGGGLVRLSHARHHLRRYGSNVATAGLIAAGIFGGTIVTWGALVTLQLFGVYVFPTGLRSLIPLTLLGSGVVVLFAVLLGLARLVTQALRDDEPAAVP